MFETQQMCVLPQNNGGVLNCSDAMTPMIWWLVCHRTCAHCCSGASIHTMNQEMLLRNFHFHAKMNESEMFCGNCNVCFGDDSWKQCVTNNRRVPFRIFSCNGLETIQKRTVQRSDFFALRLRHVSDLQCCTCHQCFLCFQRTCWWHTDHRDWAWGLDSLRCKRTAWSLPQSVFNATGWMVFLMQCNGHEFLEQAAPDHTDSICFHDHAFIALRQVPMDESIECVSGQSLVTFANINDNGDKKSHLGDSMTDCVFCVKERTSHGPWLHEHNGLWQTCCISERQAGVQTQLCISNLESSWTNQQGKNKCNNVSVPIPWEQSHCLCGHNRNSTWAALSKLNSSETTTILPLLRGQTWLQMLRVANPRKRFVVRTASAQFCHWTNLAAWPTPLCDAEHKSSVDNKDSMLEEEIWHWLNRSVCHKSQGVEWCWLLLLLNLLESAMTLNHPFFKTSSGAHMPLVECQHHFQCHLEWISCQIQIFRVMSNADWCCVCSLTVLLFARFCQLHSF